MKKRYDCVCKETKHTVDTKTPIWDQFSSIVKVQGEYMIVTVLGKGSFIVPRIYIAIHGLKAQEIDTLGFPEVPMA